MYRKDLIKNYDAIFCLGSNCQGIYYIKQHNLCCGNNPTDWLSTHSLPLLIDQIHKKFINFMALENLSIIGVDKGNHAVFDPVYNCASYHEFPLNETLEEAYPKFKETLQRRIKRFYSTLDKSKNVLFIRVSPYPNETEMLTVLLNVLSTYTDAKINLVYIELKDNITEMIEVGHEHNLICYLQFPTGENWLGDYVSWYGFLKDISLVPINCEE
ncbi:MAG TPA: DUF1796 family putative cysteine peptidase [Clostridiaceae bacterium]